jgi:hypothetical protein
LRSGLRVPGGHERGPDDVAVQGFDARQFLTYSFFFPRGYGVGLPGTYAVWLLVVAALYPLCRWVAAVKGRRRDWWLSYLQTPAGRSASIVPAGPPRVN